MSNWTFDILVSAVAWLLLMAAAIFVLAWML
jgi:hypothetical protein